MRADCHIHSGFSFDSEADTEEMIRSAIEKGLEAVCFTEHEEIDFVYDGRELVIDTEDYFRRLDALREAYRGQIEVRTGIELGLQPQIGGKLAAYAETYPFDFVIGSVHVIEGMDPYYPEYFEKYEDGAGYLRAFEETLADLQAFDGFDSLGHLDYIVRYGKRQTEEYSYRRYADLIDEILRTLAERGKGLELNTAGLKYGLPFAHPHPDILRRFRELGGEILTVGSDAHRPEHIAYGFDRVNDLLTGCGFRYYTEFVKRKPIFKRII